MSQSGPSDESYDDSKNPFVEVRILKKENFEFSESIEFSKVSIVTCIYFNI